MRWLLSQKGKPNYLIAKFALVFFFLRDNNILDSSDFLCLRQLCSYDLELSVLLGYICRMYA